MTLDIPKGVRDFLPQEKILREFIVSTLKTTFEEFGYNPVETPALELYETLSSKYAGGAEILKETYKLTDNGQRELGLRYDLTVPFARIIGMNPTLKYPFKRYQIDRVWRDGPMKLGRYREFYQCDVDIAGSASLMADAELLALANIAFTRLGLDFTLTINNRKILDAILTQSGVPTDLQTPVILVLDKLKKIGQSGVTKELRAINIDEQQIDSILQLVCITGTNQEILDALKLQLKETAGVNELQQTLEFAQAFAVNNLVVDVSLSRGLAYYTGLMYEAYLKDSPVTSSIGSGGRYDNMIGKLAQKKEEVPAVGISFGLDPLFDAMKIMKKDQLKKSVVDIYVVPIQTQKESASVVAQLRNAFLKVDMDLAGKGISKNLAFANAYGIRYVLIIGGDELASGKLTLKDMISGTEEKLSVDQIIQKFK